MQHRTILYVALAIALLAAAIPLMACCSQGDPGGNGMPAAENSARASREPKKTDPCEKGSIYKAAFKAQGVRTGTKYTGAFTILSCSGPVSYTAYFKGEDGRINVASGQVPNRIEYTDSFTTTRVKSYDTFCIKLSGADNREICE